MPLRRKKRNVCFYYYIVFRITNPISSPNQWATISFKAMCFQWPEESFVQCHNFHMSMTSHKQHMRNDFHTHFPEPGAPKDHCGCSSSTSCELWLCPKLVNVSLQSLVVGGWRCIATSINLVSSQTVDEDYYEGKGSAKNIKLHPMEKPQLF